MNPFAAVSLFLVHQRLLAACLLAVAHGAVPADPLARVRSPDMTLFDSIRQTGSRLTVPHFGSAAAGVNRYMALPGDNGPPNGTWTAASLPISLFPSSRNPGDQCKTLVAFRGSLVVVGLWAFCVQRLTTFDCNTNKAFDAAYPSWFRGAAGMSADGGASWDMLVADPRLARCGAAVVVIGREG
jgi:hypothetical protein